MLCYFDVIVGMNQGAEFQHWLEGGGPYAHINRWAVLLLLHESCLLVLMSAGALCLITALHVASSHAVFGVCIDQRCMFIDIKCICVYRRRG